MPAVWFIIGAMSDKQISFLPFHAINEFMLPEYRRTVLTEVLSQLESVSGGLRSLIQAQVRKNVQVPGFRNSNLAPLPVKVKNAETLFERGPAFVGAVLAAWRELHPDLAVQAHDLLKGRGWEVLPADADRSKLPGFMTTWPKADTFEALDNAFREAHSDSAATDDDINLMFVWIGNRLPYDIFEDEAEETAEE